MQPSPVAGECRYRIALRSHCEITRRNRDVRAVKVVAERQSTLLDEIVRKTSKERDSVIAIVALKEAGGPALRGSSDARDETCVSWDAASGG